MSKAIATVTPCDNEHLNESKARGLLTYRIAHAALFHPRLALVNGPRTKPGVGAVRAIRTNFAFVVVHHVSSRHHGLRALERAVVRAGSGARRGAAARAGSAGRRRRRRHLRCGRDRGAGGVRAARGVSGVAAGGGRGAGASEEGREGDGGDFEHRGGRSV